jgi:hypothetical protein
MILPIWAFIRPRREACGRFTDPMDVDQLFLATTCQTRERSPDEAVIWRPQITVLSNVPAGAFEKVQNTKELGAFRRCRMTNSFGAARNYLRS